VADVQPVPQVQPDPEAQPAGPGEPESRPERRRLRAAAAQGSGGVFDADRAVERLLSVVEEAGKDGIELLVLPECFVGGYPYWRGHVTVSQDAELGARLWESSILADGPHSEAIAEAAVQHGVSVVAGVNERDARPGACTAYNSVFVYDAEKGFVGARRKLVPTHTERAYWGRGTAADVRTFAMSWGELGALICYEHHMLPARLAMALLGEVVHCALWPGYWQTVSHIADKRPGAADQHAEIDAIVRNHAMSSQTFVVSANALLDVRDVPKDLRDIMGYNLARGGSSIVGPSGRYLAPPRVDEECVVSATLDFWDRALTKSYLDTIGHYGRWDVFDLTVGGRSLTATLDAPGVPGVSAAEG
jgi:amidase/nitrilase